MLNTIIVLLLKALLVVALSTFLLAWIAGVVTVIVFGIRVYRLTDSLDPLEWFSYLWSFRGQPRPPELLQIQFWQRRIWYAAVASVFLAAVSGLSLVAVVGLRGH